MSKDMLARRIHFTPVLTLCGDMSLVTLRSGGSIGIFKLISGQALGFA
jgi:hypothetical protein